MTTETYTLKILHDQDATSPREHENLGTLATWHRRYTLGDVQPTESPLEYQASLPENSLIVPVYMIDHSGIALSIRDYGDEWDSGQVGIYHLSSEQIIAEFGSDTPETRAKALGIIKSEIDVYSDYVNGNCWGFVVEDASGNSVDSCWGFIGSDVTENGLAHQLDHAYWPLLEAAVEASGGTTIDSKKFAEMQASVEAEQSAPRKSSHRP